VKSKGFSFLDPYFLGAVFLGVGLGTALLEQRPRLAVLWTTLLVLALAHRGQREVRIEFTLAGVGRGALLGLVISLPLLAFLSEQLRLFTERLFATRDTVFLFYQVCFVAAPVEELFFRGVVQAEKGLTAGLALYAGAALVYFLPHAPILVALMTTVVMGSLGIAYAYVFDRHGLAASIACHVVVGLILQVTPLILYWARIMLA